MVPRRVIVTWLVLFGLIVAAFAGTVLILNATLYSAGGHVGSYLAALARHDVSAALELAGPGDGTGTDGGTGAAKASRGLLDPRALGELHDIRQVSDIDRGGGSHRVSYSYRFGDAAGDTRATTTTFRVKYAGTHLGLFSDWQFESSPVGVLSVTPQHAAAFTVNGLRASSTAPSRAKSYLVLTPGRYVLGHSSDYFAAKPTPVSIVVAGGKTQASVDIQANSAFTKAVQQQLDGYLKECAKQQVLLPTGCPFGKEMSNRIDGLPVWSMVRNPAVKIIPGQTPGTWWLPETPATAHLKVAVRSLFDGSVSTFDEDVPFSVKYLITFEPDGRLLITGQ